MEGLVGRFNQVGPTGIMDFVDFRVEGKSLPRQKKGHKLSYIHFLYVCIHRLSCIQMVT